MTDKEEYLQRYKELYRKKEGVDLSDQEAFEHFEKLTRLVDAIYQPIQKSFFDEASCPSCRKPIDFSEFKDEISTKEFLLSGLCQECQDKIFK